MLAKKIPALLAACLLAALLLAACTSQTPAPPERISTSQPSPTPPSPTQPPVNIQEPPPVQAGEPITLSMFSMLDELSGWGMEYNGKLVRTADGGQTWIDISPPQPPGSAFFLDTRTAWAYASGESSSSLLRTLDGGQSWLPVAKALPFYGYVNLSFENPRDGWAELSDVGAGNAYISLYQTHDGGASWTQVMLTTPDDALREPGVLHLCNICGDQFYFDSQRMLVIYGELANEPAGELRLSLSTDGGQSWQEQKLPLPSAQYASGMLAPQAPVFFNQLDGLLPFGLVGYDSDGAQTMDLLTLYATHDGGQTWVVNPSVLDGSRALGGSLRILSPLDAFAPCGRDLCATHDGGASWQALGSNLSFAYTSDAEPYVWQFQFACTRHGWASSDTGGAIGLWRTRDGGVTWEQLDPRLVADR